MASNKEKQIAEALKLVEKGQHERAVKIYLKVVAEDDKDVRIWLKIGDLYAKLGRNHDAAETYEKVAHYYSDQGFYTKAIAVYKQILKLEPRLVSVNERLAELYKQMGIIPDAIEQYAALAAFHSREGNVRGSLAALKQIVELDPTNVASRVKLAEMYSKEQMVREAIDEFAKAAEYLHEQGRYDDYLKVGERLLFHAPENRPVSKELARIYLQKGDARRALPKLQSCFKADPRDVETLTLLAAAFDALGQLPKTVSVLKELARIHSENGNMRDAEETWRRVDRLVPGDPEAKAIFTGRPDSQMAPPQAMRLADQLTFSGAGGPGNTPIPPGPIRMTPSPMPIAADPPAPAPLPSALVNHKTHPGASRDPRDDNATPTSVPAVAPARSRSSSTPVPAAPAAAQAPQRENSVPGASRPAPSSDDAAVAKIFAETDVYAKYGLHEKALEHIRSVFDIAPDHVAAREKLKQLLLLLGRPHEAAEEVEKLARQLAGDPAAEVHLRELLTLDPANRYARERLTGAAVPAVAPRTTDASDEVEVDMADLEEVPNDELSMDDVSFVDAPPEVSSDAPTHEAQARADANDAQHHGSDDDGIPLVVDGSAAFDGAASDERSGPEDRFGADLGDSTEDVEDRFGVEAEGESTPDDAPAAAPSSFADEEAEATMFGGPASLTISREPAVSASHPAPPAEEVDDFDFSSFDDPSVTTSHPIAAVSAAPPPSSIKASNGVAVAHDDAPEEAPVAADEPEPATATLDDEPDAVSALAADAPYDDLLGSDSDEPTGSHAMADAVEPEAPVDSALDDDLDEADFYLQQGMRDEARAVLEGLLASHPGHPLILSKLDELAESEPAPPPSTASAPVDDSDEDALALDSFASPEPTVVASGPSSKAAAAGANRNRKNVVETGVDEDDFETHYDLGIAYREMGILDDAIGEFEIAMRDPARQVQCRLMLGLCYVLKGQNHEAINHLKQGLYGDRIQEQEQVALYYELGKVYEKLGDKAEALYYFDKIAKRGPQAAWADMHRDVERRIQSLRPPADEFAADFRREPVGAVNRK